MIRNELNNQDRLLLQDMISVLNKGRIEMHVPETVVPQMEMASAMELNDEFSSDELRSYTAYGLSHAAHHGGATMLGFRD